MKRGSGEKIFLGVPPGGEGGILTGFTLCLGAFVFSYSPVMVFSRVKNPCLRGVLIPQCTGGVW
jgi:hypothetical protein